MKAAVFDYQRADSVDHALQLIGEPDLEVALIAGGQTLVPMMATRLAMPERLVDISRIDSLAKIEQSADSISIGSVVTQAEALANPIVKRQVPLLATALPWVGHQQTRNRGTIGGSLCNADPAAEIPLVATLLDANFIIAHRGSQRTLIAEDFFQGALSTAIEPSECLLSVELPFWQCNELSKLGVGVEEMNMRASDFAIVCAAAQALIGADGACEKITCGVTGAAPTPVRAVETEQALTGSTLEDSAIDDASKLVVERLAPQQDIHASAKYRERIAPELLARAIKHARDHAVRGFGSRDQSAALISS